MADPFKLRVLVIELDAISSGVCAGALSGAEIIEKKYNLEELIETPLDPPPHLILCGNAPDGVSLTEVAQSLRMSYQECPILYISSERKNFDRKGFQKNGFTDAYILPIDKNSFDELVKDTLAVVSKGAVKSYRSVKLVDVTPETQLDFDVFVHLPANNKYIKFSSKGDVIDKTRSDRLQTKQVGSLHLPREQMTDFYKFTAKQLRNLTGDSNMSETERKDRRERAVRDLISGMFAESADTDNFSGGKGMLNDCQEIVKAYITSGPNSDQSKNWFDKLSSVAGGGSNTYSHATNVATYAALFSIGSGVGKPEDVSIAGLLHDIGLIEVPMEIQMKPESERTPEEQEVYKKHVTGALDIIKTRKMIVPENILKMIAQHHERFNGSGYPKGIAGPRILPESQILALADHFDELTAVKDGQVVLAPTAAMDKIVKEVFANPAVAPFDPEIVKKLIPLFPKKAEEENVKNVS